MHGSYIHTLLDITISWDMVMGHVPYSSTFILGIGGGLWVGYATVSR